MDNFGRAQDARDVLSWADKNMPPIGPTLTSLILIACAVIIVCPPIAVKIGDAIENIWQKTLTHLLNNRPAVKRELDVLSDVLSYVKSDISNLASKIKLIDQKVDAISKQISRAELRKQNAKRNAK